MFGQLFLSISIFIVSLILNQTKLSLTTTESSIPQNTTLFETRSQTTDLIVSDKYDITLVCVMSQQAELPVFYEVVKPTLQLALEVVQKRYPHLRIKLVTRKDDNPCLANYAGAVAAEEFYTGKVSAFIGPACSLALDPVARMASYWNVPILTGGGIGVEFSRKNIYSTLTRMAFSLDRVSHFFVKIIREYDWHHISLIIDETELSNTLIKNSLQSIFKEIEFGHEINLDIQSFNRKDNYTVNYIKLLKQASRAARVFILITTGDLVRHILLEAYDLGMNTGEYCFFGIELVKSTASVDDFSWYRAGDKRNKHAREMYEALMMIAVRVPTSPEYTTFSHKVTQMAINEFGGKFSKENVNKQMTNQNVLQVNPIVAAFYDCVLMYVWAYNKTLAIGGDPNDGRTIARSLWDSTFRDGLTGDIMINENGDREADYTLNDLDPETGIMRPVASYFGAKRVLEKVAGVEVHWPGGKKDPTLDVPDCGFTGDAVHCLVQERFPVWATILIILIFIATIGLLITIIVAKKLKLESDLIDNWWRINYEGI